MVKWLHTKHANDQRLVNKKVDIKWHPPSKRYVLHNKDTLKAMTNLRLGPAYPSLHIESIYNNMTKYKVSVFKK